MNLKVSDLELRSIRDEALNQYKNKSSKGLGADEYWSMCVLESVKGFLHRNGVEINFEYPIGKEYQVKD